MGKILLLLAVFFLTRLLNLEALPIFTDEASYWNAAREVGDNFFKNWDLSLVLPVAKPPLFILLSSLVMKAGIDGIYALRLVSVFSGFLLFTSIYFLTKELLGEREAWVSSVLYILLPFGLFYDRLGIMEILLTAFLTLSYLFFWQGLLRRSWKRMVFAGIALGLAILTKQSGQIGFLIIISLAFVFVYIEGFKHRSVIRVGYFTLAAFGISYLLSNILRISGKYPEYAAFTPTQVTSWTLGNLGGAIETTLFNVSAVGSWLKSWFTPPLFILVIASFIALIVRLRQKSLVILVLFALPILIQAILATDLFPRYFLMVVPAIILSLSSLIVSLWGIFKEGRLVFRLIIILIMIISFLPSLILSYQVIFKITDAPLHYNERWQYLSGWPSGYGVSQAASFLKSYPLPAGSKILLDGHNGHLKDSLLMLGLETKSMRYLERDFFEKEDKKKFDLIVANRSPDWEILGFEKLAIFEKPDKETAIIIFAPLQTSPD